jgi:predicted porin
VEHDGWEVSTDGRVNAFLSSVFGDGLPEAGSLNLIGGGLTGITDSDANLQTTRIRTGFVPSTLAVNVRHGVTEGLKASGRIGIYLAIQNDRNKNGQPALDLREAFFTLEGAFGSILLGRAFSVFSQHNTLMDAALQSGFGLGHPCSADGNGAACGHIGIGYLYNNFNAGIGYRSPELAGFKLSAMLYDPATVGPYNLTPLPRVEGDLTFTPELGGFDLQVFATGLWQHLGRSIDSKEVEVYGVSYGTTLGAYDVKLGLAGYYGDGLGIAVPLSDDAIGIDGEPRLHQGYYAQLKYTLGNTDLAAGYGISRAKQTEGDKNSDTALIKTQQGGIAGVYQHIGEVVFALEYVYLRNQWYKTKSDQVAHVVNAGATFVW